MKPSDRPRRVGVSACLLGEEVRYDGGHKREAWIAEVLGPRVALVAVCPEVEVGLGVPRPPIGLRSDGAGGVRLVVEETGADITDRMTKYAEERLEALAAEGLDGFILKAHSPSCGIDGVKVDGVPGGRGLFAAALLRRFPGLPVEDELRLHDPVVRAEFLRRVLGGAGA